MTSYDEPDFRLRSSTKGNAASDGSDATNVKWTQEAWINAERPLTPFDNDLKNIMIEKVRNIFGVTENVSCEKNHKALGDSPINLLSERLVKEGLIKKAIEPQIEKGKKIIEKKADIIKKQNSWNIINKELDTYFKSFKADDENFHIPALMNSKYIEIRGVGFIVCANYLMKNSKKFIEKQSKALFVNGIIVGMQKFINATRNLYSQSIADSNSTVKTSDSFLNIMQEALQQLKITFSFDGMKICANTPQLLIYTNYDCYIPTKSLSLYSHQTKLIDEMAEAIRNDQPLIVTLRTMTNTGKTTSALGIAEIVNCVRKYSGKPDLMFIFCCNIRQVMDQVSQLVFNANIPFGIAFIDKFNGLMEINNFNCISNEKRVVTVCGPDACIDLVKKYPNTVIFIDEPNINLDKGTDAAQKNVKLITDGLSKQVILSSATFFENLPQWIMDNHQTKYGPTKHVDIYSNKIHIACEIKTFDGKLMIPHSRCINGEQLNKVIRRIIANPFMGRSYTANMANSLHNIASQNSVKSLPNIKEIFDDAENLNADSLRTVCMEILRRTSDSEAVAKVCNAVINPAPIICNEEKEEADDEDIQWEKAERITIGNTLDFKTLCTISAHRFLLPTLIATENPVSFVFQYFQNIVEDFIKQFGTVKKINDDYTHCLGLWQKQIDRSNRGAKDGSINSKEERMRNEESLQLGKPIIRVSEYQINTIGHIRKYAKNTRNVIDPHMLRQELDVTEIMTCEMFVPENVRILLACGVGIVGVYGGKYAHIVNVLMNEGKLAYIVANDSIAYGTNVPINIVIVTREFSDAHSINTIYQLISRAGRVGRSWNAEAFIDESCAEKIYKTLHTDMERENIEYINFEKIHNEIVESSIEIDTKLILELAQKKLREKEIEHKKQEELRRIEEEKKSLEEREKKKAEDEKKKLQELRDRRGHKTVQISSVISKSPTSSASINHSNHANHANHGHFNQSGHSSQFSHFNHANNANAINANNANNANQTSQASKVISGFRRTSGNNPIRKIPDKSLYERIQEIKKKENN